VSFFDAQKKVWNKIAPDWHKLKVKPEERVLDFLKNQKGNIVDFGSGSGRNLINLKTKGKMYLVDFSKEMINFAKERAKENKVDAEFFVASLTKTKFEDSFFDAGIFIAALHCIPHPARRDKAVKELFRILKPGAEVFVSVWNKDSSWFRNKPKEKYIAWKDKGDRYYYLYDADEVYELFKKWGFEIRKKFNPERNIMFIARKPKE
jgi:ubiquinone/menaquinone biosynthesis C-methylase UbiE